MASAVKQRWDAIQQSLEDRRQYRGLLLENSLRVLAVSDPDTDKAAAALAVQVGHLSDPEDLPGLAHFCEHLLFMGTEKYPEEADYNKFISDHGGSRNACKSTDKTYFHFDVAPDYLRGALDRFAQFFISPLFASGSVDREINAVHSEHEKNIAQDQWRLRQLDRISSRAGHPYAKFSTGSRETLSRSDVRERLLKFHRQWYSANIMTLVIVGRESLDELEAMAVDLFSAVEDKAVEASSWQEHPCGPDEIRTCVRVVPVKELRVLKLDFPVPDLRRWYRTDPSHYINHMLGHEGPGSLYAELKRRGWAISLVAGSRRPARGFEFMYVSVDLTEEGERHVAEVADTVFQYLALLRQNGPQEWRFDECRRLREMSFRFKDKERPASYATRLANQLYYYPMEEALSAEYILDKYVPEALKTVMDLMNPDNVRITLVGKMYEPECDTIDRWYGMRYNVRKIPEDTLDRWRNIALHPELRLPDPNEFIPSDFGLVERDVESPKSPIMLSNTPLCRVWFHQDDAYKLPKSIVRVKLLSPLAYSDPHMVNVTHMFTVLLKDVLNEYAYAASVAKLDYGVSSGRNGVVITVSGFSEKLHALLREIMDSMINLRVDRARFSVLKEAYMRSLRNSAAERPTQLAIADLRAVLLDKYWGWEDLLEVVDDLTAEAVETLLPLLLNRLHLECLLEGNLTRSCALKLVQVVESRLRDGFSVRPTSTALQTIGRETTLDDGRHYVMAKKNEVHKSSSIGVYYQCGLQSTRDDVLLELLVQALKQPCFDQLRTKEQLGYIVHCQVYRFSSSQGLRVIVQSHMPPEYVDGRIEAFLHSMHDHLRTMGAKQFMDIKEALRTRKLEKPKHLGEEFGRHWAEIINQQYNFDREAVGAEDLKTLERDDLIKFFEAHICLSAPRRRKLAAHILSSQCEDMSPGLPDGLQAPPQTPAPEPITSLPAFKATHGHFPLVAPAVDVAVVR